MSDEDKPSVEEIIMRRFTTIRDLCDSAIALFAKTGAELAEPAERDSLAFEITEKIQEEIEEIREMLFEG